MATAYILKFATECWLFAAILLLGAGPGTAALRRGRLPARYWLPLTFTASCLVAYGLFWIVLLDPRAGRVAAVVCWCASVAAFAWQIRTSRRQATPLAATLAARDAWLPGLLMFALLMAYLFALFARDAPINVRFTWALPADNLIPHLFADRLEQPALRAAPFLHGLWQTSDRPPLQTALVLALRPLAPGGDYTMFVYQVLGTLCQIGWVPALYALLGELGASRRQQIFAFVGCAGSGFFLLQSLFTWPKLLAAWLFVLALALLLRIARRRDVRDAGRVMPLVGLLIALSLLSHGGAAFSVLALPVLWLSLRLHVVVTRRQMAIAAVVVAIVLAPWVAYQQFYDPPGDRLLKEHLAGLVDPDPRSLRQALVDQYATLTPGTWLAGRWANLRTQVLWDARAPDEGIADWFRRQQFFHQLFALDLLCLGFAGLRMHRLLQRLVWFALATIVVWCVLMFTPGSAIVHQGSFVATLLLCVAGAVGLASLPRGIGVTAMAAHVVLFATIWLFTDQTRVGGVPLAWKPVQTVAAVLFAIVFVGVTGLCAGTPPASSASADA